MGKIVQISGQVLILFYFYFSWRESNFVRRVPYAIFFITQFYFQVIENIFLVFHLQITGKYFEILNLKNILKTKYKKYIGQN